MPLRLYNTLSRSLEAFQPLVPGQVGVYACGPTVYRPPHIGNFRTFVFNDVLHRYLEWKGWDVRFVMNLTDVEDKIIAAAIAQGVPVEAITVPQIEAFFADLRTLGIRPADSFPRATSTSTSPLFPHTGACRAPTFPPTAPAPVSTRAPAASMPTSTARRMRAISRSGKPRSRLTTRSAPRGPHPGDTAAPAGTSSVPQ
jgi:hypothetical protein